MMPRIVQATLIPSLPGGPKMRLQYDDGFVVVADATSNDIEILEAIEQLSLEDRTELAQALEAAHAPARTRH
jgi:hypothetical protein